MSGNLTELENVTMRLDRITSMFNIMCEIYFQSDKPNEHNLKQGYTDYTNVIETIRDMVINEQVNLKEITNKLYKFNHQLKELAKLNINLLEGGDSNG